MTITLFVGGVRSGKSLLSQTYAQWLGEKRLYVATASSELAANDPQLQERIVKHQSMRKSGWHTFESPNLNFADMPLKDKDVVLIDCLTLWLGHIFYINQVNELGMNNLQDNVENSLQKLEKSLQQSTVPIVLVSSEVGQGIMPMSSLEREFCDAQGLVNQRLAKLSSKVIFVSCGLPLVLKGSLPYILTVR